MISKKELLKEMNISYGQLYRWKREGLIPDEWFIKQSVSTGQETYFKKDLILPRIKKILELKDQFQLDQLKDFFNSDSEKFKYNIRDIIMIEEIDPFILKSYSKNKEQLDLIDVILIYIFSTNQDIIDYSNYIEHNISQNITLNDIFYIIESNGINNILIVNQNSFIDHNLKIIKKINLDDVASIIAKTL